MYKFLPQSYSAVARELSSHLLRKKEMVDQRDRQFSLIWYLESLISVVGEIAKS